MRIQKQAKKHRTKLHWSKDVETAVTLDDMSDTVDEKPSHGVPLVKAEPPKVQMTEGISHYALAEQMTNYHSIDFGSHCEYWQIYHFDSTNNLSRCLCRCKFHA